mmetsp:Transcript_16789/g.45753  ORF Transcript_16789/g.45753 Transcript_16789/m.45753 type:complete len:187 (-) Transcript_16789:172-732(-)
MIRLDTAVKRMADRWMFKVLKRGLGQPIGARIFNEMPERFKTAMQTPRRQETEGRPPSQGMRRILGRRTLVEMRSFKAKQQTTEEDSDEFMFVEFDDGDMDLQSLLQKYQSETARLMEEVKRMENRLDTVVFGEDGEVAQSVTVNGIKTREELEEVLKGSPLNLELRRQLVQVEKSLELLVKSSRQ